MRLPFPARWGLVATRRSGFWPFRRAGPKSPGHLAFIGRPAREDRAATAVGSGELKNEIPSSELAAVMAAHYKGLGHMERYEYREAVEAFREVRKRAPGWIPGSINLAIALLERQWSEGRRSQESGRRGRHPTTLTKPWICWPAVLDRDPDNPHAHFCRGVILEQQGHLAEAHRHFKRVTEIDPNDAACLVLGWPHDSRPRRAAKATGPRRSRRSRSKRSSTSARPSSSIRT